MNLKLTVLIRYLHILHPHVFLSCRTRAQAAHLFSILPAAKPMSVNPALFSTPDPICKWNNMYGPRPVQSFMNDPESLRTGCESILHGPESHMSGAGSSMNASEFHINGLECLMNCFESILNGPELQMNGSESNMNSSGSSMNDSDSQMNRFERLMNGCKAGSLILAICPAGI